MALSPLEHLDTYRNYFSVSRQTLLLQPPSSLLFHLQPPESKRGSQLTLKHLISSAYCFRLLTDFISMQTFFDQSPFLQGYDRLLIMKLCFLLQEKLSVRGERPTDCSISPLFCSVLNLTAATEFIRFSLVHRNSRCEIMSSNDHVGAVCEGASAPPTLWYLTLRQNVINCMSCPLLCY